MTAPATTGPRARIVALDLTKGVLVVCMLVYHSLNYSTQRELAFRFLNFLPPSFILITGFLITFLYHERKSADHGRLAMRLLSRGVKLFLLFTLLNVAAQALIRERARGPMPGLAQFWERWFDTYISGSGRLANFEVLLPISYLLLLAPLLLWLDRRHWLVLPLLVGGTLIGFAALDATSGLWLNPQLWSAGLVGMLLGRLPIDKLPRPGFVCGVSILSYVVYLILDWQFDWCFGYIYLLQLLGAALVLAVSYSFCAAVGGTGFFWNRLNNLGRYSLVAYIGQIAILQVLVRCLGRPEAMSFALITLFFAALFLTIVMIEGIEWARARSESVSNVYSAVFA